MQRPRLAGEETGGEAQLAQLVAGRGGLIGEAPGQVDARVVVVAIGRPVVGGGEFAQAVRELGPQFVVGELRQANCSALGVRVQLQQGTFDLPAPARRASRVHGSKGFSCARFSWLASR
jgi:hypothetical protein